MRGAGTIGMGGVERRLGAESWIGIKVAGDGEEGAGDAEVKC